VGLRRRLSLTLGWGTPLLAAVTAVSVNAAGHDGLTPPNNIPTDVKVSDGLSSFEADAAE